MNRDRDKMVVGDIIATYGVDGLLFMISEICTEIADAFPKRHRHMKCLYVSLAATTMLASISTEKAINIPMPDA